MAGGMGSTLMFRIKEADMRMRAAQAIGLGSRPQVMASGISHPIQGSIALPNQPPQPASADVPVKDRMLSEAEAFLSGLGQVSSSVTQGGIGEGPTGPLGGVHAAVSSTRRI